jgi:ABC-type Mn2+/Zn2+ transport system ATPase subunit
MPIAEIQNLTFSYDGTSDVISNINLGMEEGQSLFIVGDNGSGKTTLGRLLSGLEKPTKGTITIAGEKPSEVEIGRRCQLVSFMGQVSHLSVLKSSIAGEIASFSRESKPLAAEEAYREWATLHSLPTNTDMNPRDLTTPDLWRFVLGLYAVVLQPMVLVVDEVFCAGSKQQQDCALDVLERRQQQGKATIFLYQRNLSLPFDLTGTLYNNKLTFLKYD